ncbi:hypothetical protein DXU03_30885 [Rhizobium johnstonii]
MDGHHVDMTGVDAIAGPDRSLGGIVRNQWRKVRVGINCVIEVKGRVMETPDFTLAQFETALLRHRRQASEGSGALHDLAVN